MESHSNQLQCAAPLVGMPSVLHASLRWQSSSATPVVPPCTTLTAALPLVLLRSRTDLNPPMRSLLCSNGAQPPMAGTASQSQLNQRALNLQFHVRPARNSPVRLGMLSNATSLEQVRSEPKGINQRNVNHGNLQLPHSLRIHTDSPQGGKYTTDVPLRLTRRSRS